MAYRLTYDGEILFDPYTDAVIYDAQLTAKANNPDYLDFTVPPTHPLYGEVRGRGGLVRLEWDATTLFLGEVESVETDVEGAKQVACVGALSWLGDTVVRPYSTLEGEQPLAAPSTVDGLLAWYVDQHNAHVLDGRRRFAVGVNQGWALDENNRVYRSSTQLPTTWDEISDKLLDTLGGYVSVRYDPLTVDYWADVHETNAQVIDFGVNITDFSETADTAGMYTAVRPVGSAPEKEEEAEEDPEAPTLDELPDGPTDAAGIHKLGDVVYSPEAVALHGYRECAFSDNDCTTAAGLLASAVKRLQALMAPTLSVTVKAVDLALFTEGHEHLRVGQAVRVRSAFHGVDEYLMVTSATVDLQDPGNTEYTLGAETSTLTGQQSGYLRGMNGSINAALDTAQAMGAEAKAAAKDAGEAARAYADGKVAAASEAIATAVSEAYETKADAEVTKGRVSNAESSAKANSDGVQAANDSLAAAQAQAQQATASLADRVAAAERSLGEQGAVCRSVESYMTFADAAGGQPQLTIGTTSSAMSTVITNSQMRFEQAGGGSLLTVDGETSSVKAASLTMGSYRWRAPDGKRIQLIYAGEGASR